MMLAGLLFLLSLTGGSASNYYSATTDSPHDQPSSSSSPEQSTGGSTSNYSAPPDLLDDPWSSNSSFEQNGEYSKQRCTYLDVVRHLNLTNGNKEKSLARPGYSDSPIEVKLDVQYAAIHDVNEKDQKFVSTLWMSMKWKDESLSWTPEKFCDIKSIVLSASLVWKPDLTIEEMIKKENTLLYPYVKIYHKGEVYQRSSMVLTSTCKMEVNKFPFDVQSCSLSFKSVIHYVSALKLEIMRDPNRLFEWTKEMMQTGSEWLFVDLKTDNKTSDQFGYNRSMLVYTITMKRRPVLYIANFLLPVLFFFCLDLASFLISDRRGEKLSFKVTVLLAVTVMQLILNEILPSTSDRVPLIVVYCIGMFGLLMISLFETILVMHLMEKDNKVYEDQNPNSEGYEDKQSKVSFYSSSKELKKWTPCACVCDVSADEPPSELLSATKEVNSSKLTQESIALEKVSDELKEVIQLLNNKEEARKFGYWTRVAKKINKVFIISYVTVASVFLVVIFSLWNSE